MILEIFATILIAILAIKEVIFLYLEIADKKRKKENENV